MPRGAYGLPAGLTPEEVFSYAYAVFFSPGYRNRYAEFLNKDFPRLPIIHNLESFRALSQLGDHLIGLHLLSVPTLEIRESSPTVVGQLCIEKASWSNQAIWVNKSKTAGFVGVSEQVWKYSFGGYQVCEKWLKDRKGQILSAEDVTHYRKMIHSISETMRIEIEIEALIERCGGWPIAFQNERA